MNRNCLMPPWHSALSGTRLFILVLWGCLLASCDKPQPSDSPTDPTDESVQLMDFMKGNTPLPEKDEIDRQFSESGQVSAIYLAQMANYWMKRFEYDSAIHYYLILLDKSDTFTTIPLKAEVLKNLGALAYYKEDFTGSIDLLLSAMEEYEFHNDTHGIAAIHNNIGSIYYATKDYDKAMEFFQKSLEIKENLSDSVSIARTLNNIANVYADKNDLEASLEYNLRALALKEAFQPDNYSSLGSSFNNIALNYKNLRDFPQAETYAQKCLEANQMAANKEGIMYAHNTLAIIHYEKKDYIRASDHAEKTLSMAIEEGSVYMQERAHLVLANINKASGKPLKAFDHLKSSMDLKDTLLSEEKNKAIAELQEKYESVKKEKEIQLLHAEKEIQMERARKDRQLKTFLIAFLSALALLLLSLWSQYRQKIRTNIILQETNSALGELNALKDRLFATMTHDLKGPISAFQSITTALSENLQRLDKDQIKSYLLSLKQSSVGISHTLHNILNWAKSQKGLQTVVLKNVSLHTLLDEVESQLEIQLQDKSLKIQRNIAPDTILSDRDILEITLRNLISNAIKYSPEGEEITVKGEQLNGSYTIFVEDKGAGMPHDLKEVLFDPVERNKYDHKERKEGSGIGLILVKESLEKINGQIRVSSSNGNGTSFIVELPQTTENDGI